MQYMERVILPGEDRMPVGNASGLLSSQAAGLLLFPQMAGDGRF
jgi:hypothetical protein